MQTPILKIVYYVGVVQYDITEMTEDVKWSGDIKTSYRKLDVKIANTDASKKDELTALNFETGRPLFFYVDNKEVFRGIIFDTGFDSGGSTTLSAFDEAKYLTTNEDTRFLIKTTASAFISKLCKDFDIAVGTIANTGYTIDKLIFRGETLWDMIQKVLTKTRDETGRRYWVYVQGGKLNVVERKNQVVRWVLEDNVNIMDSSRRVNIEELRNQIKVTTGSIDDKKPKMPTSVIAKDDPSISRYGRMQLVDDMGDKMTTTRLNERAKILLKEKNKPRIDVDVTALGIAEVYSGKSVLVYDKRVRINGGYYVQDDTHSWDASGQYSMTLSLSATDDLPFVDLSQEDEKKAPPKYKTAINPLGNGGPGVSRYDEAQGIWV
jgi:hypothetical protein